MSDYDAYDAAVQAELDQIPAEERPPAQPPKMTKVQSAYTAVPGKHQCQECWFYIEHSATQGVCALVAGTIKAIGTCNFWKKGTYMAAGRAVENPTKVGQIEAGYLERPEGVRCATCQRYRPTQGRCQIVYGPINPEHCCSYWSDGVPWVP